MSSCDNMLVFVVLAALLFASTIGFQDSSSIAASALATRALTVRQSIIVIAIFAFLGAAFGGSAVAQTLCSITSSAYGAGFLVALACGLIAAIIWNFAARRLGLPSSSTHALVGGLIGSIAMEERSIASLVWIRPGSYFGESGISKTLASMLVGPLCGFLLSLLIYHLLVFGLSRARSSFNRRLRQAQLLIIPALAFGNGANVTQLIMGVIMMALSASGHDAPSGQSAFILVEAGSSQSIPYWVRFSTALSFLLGVIAMAPRVLKRLVEIYKLRPIHGLSAGLAASAVTVSATFLGGPLSTSQVVASSLVGVGAAERPKGVKWGAVRIVLHSWFVTIPGTAILSALIFYLLFSGTDS